MSQQPPPPWDPDPSTTPPPVSGPYHYPGQPGDYPGQPAAVMPGYDAPWQGYLDPNDPLVTPPDGGVNGWWARAVAAYRRSWRSAGVIIGLTQTVPAMAFSVLSLNYLGAFGPAAGSTEPLTTAEAEAQLSRAFGFLGITLVAVILLSFVQALGWAAGTWAVTREAAGAPAPLGDAFAYGLRRAPGLWGWTLLSGLITVVGFCACILPGFYLIFALALMGPVYLFERDNPIGRSFRLAHANVGGVLGRLAIIAAVLIGGQFFAGVVQNVGFVAAGVANAGAITPAGAVFAIIGTALTLPFTIFQLVSLITTYAEQRAREVPVTVTQLAGALD